ncbi:MAG: DUF4124 domain-containing protein [Proteobacteria bacterium]|nr:DUF4124 domain-containing protein [Pseudomonadota bacterium]
MEARSILILAGLLAASLAMAETAYKWTEEDGVVHYSDRPREGAERVELADSERPNRTRFSPSRSTDAAPAIVQMATFRYESLSVASPSPEETLWNIGGVLNVTLVLDPGLQAGHQVRVYFDGGEPTIVTGQNFQLEEVYRGVHNIQVEVIDETGKLMIRSVPNRFYVQQNTINVPGRT